MPRHIVFEGEKVVVRGKMDESRVFQSLPVVYMKDRKYLLSLALGSRTEKG